MIRPALALLALAAPVLAAAAPPATLPALFPAPAAARLTGGQVRPGAAAVLVAPPGVDEATLSVVRDALARAGVTTLRVARRAPAHAATVVTLAIGADPATTRALAALGAHPVAAREGYALAIGSAAGGVRLLLAGADADGLFHAAQTLAQIATGPALPALAVEDQPAMAIRGTIEGFYGAPWSQDDRLAHLRFLASVKANTYVYSPKDDPFARARWREPYPAAERASLATLITAARAAHVRFTYAISPGPSICYSDPADFAALTRKFDDFRALGVRAFYIAFDDIEYTRWNCAADAAALGPPGEEAAGRAQAMLVNRVYAWLAARDGADAELMIVPTEYYNTTESPYKAALRAVDPHVLVQWTGTDVVPPAIAVRDARAATQAFGRKTLLWDNYPVNDYGESTGRLLMAPYRDREAGLSDALSGILANPMNQEAPSRVAVFGTAAFAWNDRAYDPDRAWTAAARQLAGGDPAVTEALLTLFDLEHLAPTFGAQPWQPQAPRLKPVLDGVEDALASGTAADRRAALTRLHAAAQAIATAPDRIRAGVRDPGFLAQCAPWLAAMQLWGRALATTADALDAALAERPDAAGAFAYAARLAEEAGRIQTLPNTTRPQGAIRLGDGVLDRFIATAPTLVATPVPPQSGAAQARR
ncbi:beta-N-acetylhexosaminidase family protein [Sphingomonas morindae]|uniref:Beta-N-acetylglucosaminidase domain-containing protein n=1 Tax=Sphingomonas morindae TaxID=1541170 RepID=A0ABY4X763_9SPHN|nr:beta-N-acetylglucosaminidase domain-containing protein [Sphingomonas morindae]USI72745.1 beta-N-acetylglucosaminidase domain-containing protein [Sphingomonas morindae]